MPRNKKRRWIDERPPAGRFAPPGAPPEGDVSLAVDEYEALRLADYEGLKQQEVAERLGVSRPTVSRILESARRKLASTLVEGRGLVIEGGPVRFRGGRGATRRRGRGGRRHRGGRGGARGR